MIYLDNAATTFPKPKCMLEAVAGCINHYCGNPGRSGHVMSTKASEKIYECREAISAFFVAKKPENVVFTANTTYALNIAIKSLYQPNSHILISNMEHNSVLRPIEKLKSDGKIDYSVFNVLLPDEEIISELNSKVRANTNMLVMTHASNLCGRVFPIKKIGEFCNKNNITFVVDAAQSAGINKIEFDNWHIDALCVPAHKGLYGPQGLGFIIFGEKPRQRTIIEGGNGINSLALDMGDELPESFECGTMATPLIAGLCASLKWLNGIGMQNIKYHEAIMAKMMTERLLSIPHSSVYGTHNPQNGVVLYSNSRKSVNLLANRLDKLDICTRGGFHCAPLAHRSLGTTNEGALRFSFGFFNTKKELDKVYKALKTI